MNKPFTFIICLLVALGSCTSGRKAMKQGNYDEAVYKAVKRLRSNADHKKSLSTLEQTYPLAQKWHLERIKNTELSYERFKWEPIAREYIALNSLYDEISRCPGCLSAVSMPVNYRIELESAALRAAAERYQAGLEALEQGRKGSREEAKQAYNHFHEADYWLKDYKDVAEKLKEALNLATITVVVERIPMHSATLKLSNEFFENKINEFLLHKPINRFVRFYTAQEAKKLGINQPDQIIQLSFDDFVVGQTYLHEKEVNLIKDSILLGTYQMEVPVESSQAHTNTKINICHKTPGSTSTKTLAVTEAELQEHIDHGDKIGHCAGDALSESPTAGTKLINKSVYGKAKATVHAFTRTVESKGLLDLRIIDAYSERVISQEKLLGGFLWQSEWGYFNGDERALQNTHLKLIKNRDVPPPPPQQLFIEFTQPIYQQLTAKIAVFYANY